MFTFLLNFFVHLKICSSDGHCCILPYIASTLRSCSGCIMVIYCGILLPLPLLSLCHLLPCCLSSFLILLVLLPLLLLFPFPPLLSLSLSLLFSPSPPLSTSPSSVPLPFLTLPLSPPPPPLLHPLCNHTLSSLLRYRVSYGGN